jgi:energy-coupling factor transport system ATP-binding protein
MTRLTARGFAWRDDDQRRIGPIDFDIEGPGLVLLTGPSGSGKSTLLRAMAGVLEPFEPGWAHGTLLRDGRPPGPQDVALVPQDPLDSFLSSDALHELTLRYQLAGATRRDARPAARQMLERIRLDEVQRVGIDRLSGGEQRRLALEAALITRPRLLLLDEPLDHLDRAWRQGIIERIEREREHRLVLVATHEPLTFARADARLQLPTESLDTAPDPAHLPTPRPMAHPARIRTSGLTHRIGDRTLLRDVNLDLGVGFHVLQGDNGSGKTTLLRILFGFQRPASGRVLTGGVDPVARGPKGVAKAAVLLLEHPTRMFFAPTARREIAFGAPDETTVRAALAYARLVDHAEQSPFTLSGGERERLGLALLASRPRPVVLLDEPTHGLDDDARRRLVDLAKTWARDRCVLVASHDQGLANAADHVLHLEDARIRHADATEALPSIPA